MTLYELVVAGGIVLSLGLMAILVALGPVRHAHPMLCLRARPDADCPQECLRSCPLVPTRPATQLGRRVGHAGGRA
ncbi:MAG TPA: hypothetical protein VFG59_19885 [Anaeromyxobacter sp.]|nr:hypothetical protein [Anaeromyxobacter sp.]